MCATHLNIHPGLGQSLPGCHHFCENEGSDHPYTGIYIPPVQTTDKGGRSVSMWGNHVLCICTVSGGMAGVRRAWLSAHMQKSSDVAAEQISAVFGTENVVETSVGCYTNPSTMARQTLSYMVPSTSVCNHYYPGVGAVSPALPPCDTGYGKHPYTGVFKMEYATCC